MAPTDRPAAQRKTSTVGDETRARILAATLETLRTEGRSGTSARAIARTGDFNQALIFYHFGSLSEVVLAAVRKLSARRLEEHRARLIHAESLDHMVSIAEELHKVDQANGTLRILNQVFANAANDSSTGPLHYADLAAWATMVSENLERILAPTPHINEVPTRALAETISTLLLGSAMIDELEPAYDHAGLVFSSLGSLARLVERLLASAPPQAATDDEAG